MISIRSVLRILWVLVGISFFAYHCNERISNSNDGNEQEDTVLVDTYGQRHRFEVATWNIRNFPKQGEATITILSQMIKELDIDLIAVQEISNTAAFDSLLSKIPGWQGKLTDYSYSDGSYQKTGFIYKNSFLSMSHIRNIEINGNTPYGNAFPRPPFGAYVKVLDLEGIKYDFNMIVLHLKAYGGEENEARRRLACELLKDYIDEEIAHGADPDFIVLGDWNDSLDDAFEDNVFLPFLNDEKYIFLTGALRNQYSYIDERYRSLIDHILITSDSEQEYFSGETQVLYLDSHYPDYPLVISDHRPVLSQFGGFEIELRD